MTEIARLIQDLFNPHWTDTVSEAAPEALTVLKRRPKEAPMTPHLLLAELLEPGFMRLGPLYAAASPEFSRDAIDAALLMSPWFERVYLGFRLSRMGREALKRERGHRPQRRPNEC